MADGSLYNGDLLVVDCAEAPARRYCCGQRAGGVYG
jgi:hypothetical protein